MRLKQHAKWTVNRFTKVTPLKTENHTVLGLQGIVFIDFRGVLNGL